MYLVRGRGRDRPGSEERHLGNREAAVYYHSLDRLNVINDSLKKYLKKVVLSCLLSISHSVSFRSFLQGKESASKSNVF